MRPFAKGFAAESAVLQFCSAASLQLYGKHGFTELQPEKLCGNDLKCGGRGGGGPPLLRCRRFHMLWIAICHLLHSACQFSDQFCYHDCARDVLFYETIAKGFAAESAVLHLCSAASLQLYGKHGFTELQPEKLCGNDLKCPKSTISRQAVGEEEDQHCWLFLWSADCFAVCGLVFFKPQLLCFA